MPPCPMGTFSYTIRPGDTIWQIAQRFNTSVYSIASVNQGLDLRNLFVGQVICIRSDYGQYPPVHYPNPTGISRAEADFKNYLRMLWEQHIIWTRLAILSIVFNLPDTDVVTKRLLRNPKDFETALKPFYGEAASKKFAELFSDHLIIAAKLVKAAKAGDNKAAAEAEKGWYANADEIAHFLGSINPYWSENDWRVMLHNHLALTKAEAVKMTTKNYSEGITVFDEIEKQALEMADVMANGIVKQFPGKFTG